MSKREWTVAERAQLILDALEPVDLSTTQMQQLDDLLYTLAEADEFDLSLSDAERLMQLIDIVKEGRYDKEMRL